MIDANERGNTQSENGNSLSFVYTPCISYLSSIFTSFCKYYPYLANVCNTDCLTNGCCCSSDKSCSSFNSSFISNDDSCKDEQFSLNTIISSSSSLHPSILHQQNSFLLPKQSSSNQGKKTLVLDLDETLVHASLSSQDPYDFSWCSPSSNSMESQLFITIRPGVSHFLKSMNEVYEIVLFTASTEVVSRIE